jgi:hypothetical protein
MPQHGLEPVEGLLCLSTHANRDDRRLTGDSYAAGHGDQRAAVLGAGGGHADDQEPALQPAPAGSYRTVQPGSEAVPTQRYEADLVVGSMLDPNPSHVRLYGCEATLEVGQDRPHVVDRGLDEPFCHLRTPDDGGHHPKSADRVHVRDRP